MKQLMTVSSPRTPGASRNLVRAQRPRRGNRFQELARDKRFVTLATMWMAASPRIPWPSLVKKIMKLDKAQSEEVFRAWRNANPKRWVKFIEGAKTSPVANQLLAKSLAAVTDGWQPGKQPEHGASVNIGEALTQHQYAQDEQRAALKSKLKRGDK